MDLLSHQAGLEDRHCLLCPATYNNKSSSVNIYIRFDTAETIFGSSWVWMEEVGGLTQRSHVHVTPGNNPSYKTVKFSVSLPWVQVFLLDLWLLEHHVDPEE